MLKQEVLRGKKDFAALYNNGKSVREKFFILLYRKNGLSFTRRAFLASKKVGNSVNRNRARRLLKESYRRLDRDVRPGYDLLFIARKSIVPVKCQEVQASMEKALISRNLLAEAVDLQ